MIDLSTYSSTNSLTLTLPSPAKLNLMLHITGRRPDGYHNLQTIFQFLDYGDTLSFTLHHHDKSKNGSITLSPEIPGVSFHDNLIVKAAQMMQNLAAEQNKVTPGVHITLDKRLPMGGGLGGGSSNAATTLLALNVLWQLNLPLNELADAGLSLGADVPVFVKGQAAFAEGVGEILTPVPELAEHWFLVVVPDVHVNTAEIFSNKSLTRDTPVINIRTALREGGKNDCQAVVSMIYPIIGNTLNLLNNFSPAKLTGTGACVFSSFNSESEAISVSEQLPAEFSYFIARGINESSTHKVLFTPS